MWINCELFDRDYSRFERKINTNYFLTYVFFEILFAVFKTLPFMIPASIIVHRYFHEVFEFYIIGLKYNLRLLTYSVPTRV